MDKKSFEWDKIRPKKWNGYARIYDIKEAEAGRFYLLTGDGLYVLENDVFSFIDSEHLLSEPQMGSDKRAIILGSLHMAEGLLYVLQHDGIKAKLAVFDNEQYVAEPRLFNEEAWKSQNLHYSRYLPDSTLWILTATGGAVQIASNKTNQQEERMVLYPKKGISDIVIDREGNYWVSSLKSGVYVIPQMSLKQVLEDKYDLPIGAFGKMEKMDSLLLLGTSHGKVLSLNRENQALEHEYKVPVSIRQNITYLNEKVYIGGGAYQYCFDKKEPPIDQVFPWNNIMIKNMTYYKDSLLLQSLGSVGVGIISIKDTYEKKDYPKHLFPYFRLRYFFSKKKKKYCYIKVISEKRCNWVLSDEKNDRFLTAMDTLTCYPEKGPSFPVFTENQEPISATYLEMDEDGSIWVCTINKGIYSLDQNLNVSAHFTEKDGLLNNKVRQLRVTKEGLWLLTKNGIQFFNPETKEARNYTKQDGLPTHEIRDIAIIDNKVWLSTAKGLVFFDENMRSSNKKPPLVFIKGIAIHEKDTTLHEHYELAHTQNALTIYLEGIAYRSRGAFQYKYRMLGIDSLWRYQKGTTNFIRYPQLNSGDYTLEVKAVNEDGVESEEAVVVRFTIAFPFWQTWWFQSVLYFLGIGSIVVIVLFREELKRKEARQQDVFNALKMQALQSQMNPHFIFNVLTAVQNLWLQHKNELAMDLQSNFAKLLRKIFQYSSKKAISIEQVVDFLKNYLSLEQIRFDEHQVDIKFEAEEHLLKDDYLIPPLLIQPIIENSFKHGLFHKKADRRLSIELRQAQQHLHVCIEDNGIGRQPKPQNAPKRSSGLSTTQERLVILQEIIIKRPHLYNNIKITDLKTDEGKASGTKVELWIPFVDLS